MRIFFLSNESYLVMHSELIFQIAGDNYVLEEIEERNTTACNIKLIPSRGTRDRKI